MHPARLEKRSMKYERMPIHRMDMTNVAMNHFFHASLRQSGTVKRKSSVYGMPSTPRILPAMPPPSSSSSSDFSFWASAALGGLGGGLGDCVP